MPKPLPIKLKSEPLVEAVCQLRMSGNVALSTLFPGLLLSRFPADVAEVLQLPTAMIPEQMRAMQPEMAFAPLVQLKFKNVSVLIGERAITVSNPAPYLGWDGFKPLIVEVFTALLESKLVSLVERYSLKYTNVIPTDQSSDSLNALALELKVGKLELNQRATMVRTETVTDELVTIITLSGRATVQAEGRAAVQGILVDVDTICQNKSQTAESFAQSMSSELDRVRGVNKKAFFECLTDEGLYALEPIYQ